MAAYHNMTDAQIRELAERAVVVEDSIRDPEGIGWCELIVQEAG